MAEWWTKRSLPWSSGVMKPKPFSSLNHFTVPVAMWCSSGGSVRAAKRGRCWATTADAGTAFAERTLGQDDVMIPGRGREGRPRSSSRLVVAMHGHGREGREADGDVGRAALF